MYPLAPLEPRTPGCPIPLSATQMWYWRTSVCGIKVASRLRICAASLRFSGSLDRGLLQESVERVLNRHESLRTRICTIEDEPSQVIEEAATLELPVIDLSDVPPQDRAATARQLCSELLSEPVDLTAESLYAIRLFKFSDFDHVLLFAVDHMVSDGISCTILCQEVLRLYGNRVAHLERALPNLRLQFPDVAAWQHRTREAWNRTHGPYWKSVLVGAPNIQIPTDRAALENHRLTDTYFYVPFGKRLTTALQDRAREEGALLPMVVFSTYLAVIATWCASRDLLVGFLSHGRFGQVDLTHMVGCLAYPMYLRVEVLPSESFRDLLRRVVTEFQRAASHDAGRVGGYLMRELPTQLYFNWVPNQSTTVDYDHVQKTQDSVVIRPFPIRKEWQATFTPHFQQTPAGIVAAILYRSDLIDGETLKWLAQRMLGASWTFAQNPAVPLATIGLVE